MSTSAERLPRHNCERSILAHELSWTVTAARAWQGNTPWLGCIQCENEVLARQPGQSVGTVRLYSSAAAMNLREAGGTQAISEIISTPAPAPSFFPCASRGRWSNNCREPERNIETIPPRLLPLERRNLIHKSDPLSALGPEKATPVLRPLLRLMRGSRCRAMPACSSSVA